MENYVIFTDSGCDIPQENLSEYGIMRSPLTFKFRGSDVEYKDGEMKSAEFYNRLRCGEVAATSAVSSGVFLEEFENILKEGRDILYIGFSSALSATYNSARTAMDMLRDKYPRNSLVAVDSLCASAGQGLLLSIVKDAKDNGATLNEAANLAQNTRHRISHWFTVSDLMYLKRGGRINPFLAFAGNAIGIKPVLHVDTEGRLVNVAKVRGRRNAVLALADKYGEYAEDKMRGRVYISHGDCFEDACLLADVINDRYGGKAELITDVGAVIGAHSGPGTLALFFEGRMR